MEFDDILTNHVGEFGTYQILLTICVTSAAINAVFSDLDYTFLGDIPNHWCNDVNISSQVYRNVTVEELQRFTSPELPEGGGYDTCVSFVRNYSTVTTDEVVNVTFLSDSKFFGDKVKCKNWVFDQSQYTSTIVSEWDLVCDQEWLIATSQAVYMVAKFTMPVGGWLCDKFGRRPVALGILAVHVLSRISAACSVHYYMFVTSRFFMSVASVNWYALIFIISVELVGPKWRVFAGQLPYFFWSVGYVMLSAMAYMIRDWRQLTIILNVFAVPYFLQICFLPESPRWLMSTKRNKKAAVILKRMAYINRTHFPEYILSEYSGESFVKVENQEDGNDSVCDFKWLQLFKSWKLLKITLILIVNWLVANGFYWGLVYYLPKLGGNIYVSTAISGALEVPALFFMQFSLDKFGRRFSTSGTFLLSGLSLLTILAIPKDHTWLIISLALLAKFSITGTFSAIYIYSSELYPTTIRAEAMSFFATIAGITSVLSPYINMLVKISAILPSLLLGIAAVVSGILALFLPETSGVKLPDSFKQLEKQLSLNNKHNELEGMQKGGQESTKVILLHETNA